MSHLDAAQASASGELVFAAHYVPLVRTLSGDTVEGIAFTSHDAQQEFQELRRRTVPGTVPGAVPSGEPGSRA